MRQHRVFGVSSTASAVFVWGPAGMIPLVNASERTDAPRWKFPSGCAQNGENPLATAVRKLRAETGLCIERAKVFGHTRKNGGHVLFFFYTVVDSFTGLKDFGDSGEEVVLCSAGELLDHSILIPTHLQQYRLLLKKFGCL